jgi:hypothetical protein
MELLVGVAFEGLYPDQMNGNPHRNPQQYKLTPPDGYDMQCGEANREPQRCKRKDLYPKRNTSAVSIVLDVFSEPQIVQEPMIEPF